MLTISAKMRALIPLLALLLASCAADGSRAFPANGDATPLDVATGDRPIRDTPRDTPPVTDLGEPDVRVDRPDIPAPDLGPALEELRIEPSIIELSTDVGTPTSTAVRAYATYSDGAEVDVTSDGDWWSDDPETLRIADDGIAEASGRRSGNVGFHIRHEGIQAHGAAMVRVESVTHDEDVLPEEIDAFEAADPFWTTPPTWRYPEHETVYPAGLVPPVLQWDNAGNTLIRLEFHVGDHAHVVHYTRANSYTFTEDNWRLLAEHYDLPLQMTLAGTTAPGEHVSVAEPRTLITADADLEGSVYYWQVRTGDIMEIPYDDPAARPLFPDNAESGACRGCHAITRDGGRIGFMYNGGGNPRAGVAWVDEPTPPVVENYSEFQWDFLSFDPAGHRAAAVILGDMWLADTTPGLPTGIANLGPVPGANDDGRRVTTPAWSPDGSTLLFIERAPGGVDWSFETGDLWSMTWNDTAATWGTPRELLAAPGESYDTVSYPTWSPDSRWLAYGLGPNNRGDPPSEIHMMDAMTEASVRLTRGAPDGVDVMPAFSPFREGGYYWLLFYSRRPYGHVSTQKQLWVMAIDADHVVDGSDPSHPAFWLPGQSPAEANITAYWARSGCEREGNPCKTDLDCCAGMQCLNDPELGEVCTRVECTLPGHGCSDDVPCCGGFECAPSLIGLNVCQEAFGP